MESVSQFSLFFLLIPGMLCFQGFQFPFINHLKVVLDEFEVLLIKTWFALIDSFQVFFHKLHLVSFINNFTDFDTFIEDFSIFKAL